MYYAHRHGVIAFSFILSTLLFLISCNTAASKPIEVKPAIAVPDATGTEYPIPADRPIRNVIFLIGDGMGFTQMTAGRIATYGVNSFLTIEKMPVTGIVHTHALDKLVTDSAASATALASGSKTRNGMIGMLPDGRKTVTLMQLARDRGMKTALVSTSSITHATPASFMTHVISRKFEPIIAGQLIRSGVDVMLGGGKSFFVPKSDSISRRPDEKNLLEAAKNNGYQLVLNKNELANLSAGKVLGLFAAGGLKNDAHEPSVNEMTQKALELIKGTDKGFFLMVEGSQIDWGGHANEPDYVIREMIAFDKAVKTALDFAKADGETLVIVTADHETGGMGLHGGSNDGSNLKFGWTTDYHTGEPVAVFAYGPHCLNFTGVYDNTGIPKKTASILGMDNFPAFHPAN
ncbi:MAG: alkaline phosphatase [Calditrichota bacterium]